MEALTYDAAVKCFAPNGEAKYSERWRIADQKIKAEYPIPPNPKAIEYVLSLRMSELVETMHSIFHEVASRRIMTRFGMLNDHPRSILDRRDEHDKEAA